ncbi:hypervirulence associated TUDOR domain-containing protein [Arthrobacter pigmenti]
MSFKKNETVSWNTPQGETHGKIVEKREREFTFEGQKFNATKEEPFYIVESGKSGSQAAHKGSALKTR